MTNENGANCGILLALAETEPISIASTLRSFHHINEMTIFTLSMILNPTLFLLIVTEKDTTLRIYSRVLLQNCIIDILYTVVCALSELQIKLTHGYFVVTVNSALRTSPIFYHYIMAFCYCLFCASAINIVCVMFYFRYTLICRSEILLWKKLCGITALAILFASIQAYFIMLAIGTDKTNRVKMCSLLKKDPIWCERDVQKPVVVCMWTSVSNPYFACFLVMGVITNIGVYAVISVCGYAIYRNVNTFMKKASFSHKSARLQHQMNSILVVQMVLPLLTAVIPTALLIVFTLMKIDVPAAGIVLTMALSWIPIISPITTIFMVSNFRQRFLRILTLCSHKPISADRMQTKSRIGSNSLTHF